MVLSEYRDSFHQKLINVELLYQTTEIQLARHALEFGLPIVETQ